MATCEEGHDEETLYGDDGPIATHRIDIESGVSRAQRTRCEVDGRAIRVIAFLGTGVCSEDCRKKRDGETP